MRLWQNAWQELIPFLDYDVEIGKVICSTNVVEILNARPPAGRESKRPLPDRASGAENACKLSPDR